jgi:FKBP-type peptidyl-prolyl cis-trans isomerase FkpA
MKRLIPLIALLSFVFYACQKKGHDLKTASGFRYILYTESKGPRPQVGDYVTVQMSYRNAKDSVMFDWKKNGQPIRFQLERIPFKGSFEEGITNISEGDSATFFVPADSLYNIYFANSGKPQKSTAFIPGTDMKFEIRLVKVQTPAQAEGEMLLTQVQDEKKENEEILSYVSKKNISASPDTSGYYLIVNQRGTGEIIDSGKVVTVLYTGKFLNDSIFDQTTPGKPYQYIQGSHRGAIRAWEYALKGLPEGSKITLLVPSKLAFGSEGIRKPETGEYMIRPNTPLIFDMEIVGVEDAPAVSNN